MNTEPTAPSGNDRNRAATGERTVLLWDCTSAVLLLVLPFAVFLGFHGYDPLREESLVMLAILAATGLSAGVGAWWSKRWLAAGILAVLMTLFVDTQFQTEIQSGGGMYAWAGRLAVVFLVLWGLAWLLRRHSGAILTAALAVTGTMAVLFPSTTAVPSQAEPSASAAPSGKGPLYLHIVLDEHIGIEGIPTRIDGGIALKDELKTFFTGRGFRLFGKAYANFSATELTLANLVNFRNRPERDLLDRTVGRNITQRGTGGVVWRPRGNALFKLLNKQGYRLHVFQVDSTVFCGTEGDGALVAECRTYPCCTIHEIEDIPLPARDKLRVMATFFLEPLVSYRSVRKAYRWLAHKGFPLPVWDWETSKVAAVAGARALDELAARLRRARRGEAYFAHVLLPHFPYVFDAACRYRPTARWLNRWSEEGQDLDRWTAETEAQKNTPATRAERYRAYFDQTRCANKLLERVFEALREAGLYDEAVIVVHGDHGSRITLRDPEGAFRLTKADAVDSYSTLFAVKAPGVAPGYDMRLGAVANLFAGFVRSNFRDPDPRTTVSGLPPEILFPQVNGQDRRMFDFGEGAAFVP